MLTAYELLKGMESNEEVREESRQIEQKVSVMSGDEKAKDFIAKCEFMYSSEISSIGRLFGYLIEDDSYKTILRARRDGHTGNYQSFEGYDYVEFDSSIEYASGQSLLVLIKYKLKSEEYRNNPLVCISFNYRDRKAYITDVLNSELAVDLVLKYLEEIVSSTHSNYQSCIAQDSGKKRKKFFGLF